MQVNVQMVISHDDQKIVQNILCFERQELSIDTLGLTLEESKTMTAEAQRTLAEEQVKEYVSQHRTCPHCNKLRAVKGYHTLVCRTLFGKIRFQSPRLVECACHDQKVKSISPLSQALVGRATPEFLYLESKWASLMSYGMAADMLAEAFPIKVSPATVCDMAMKVATRLEQELPGEQHMYVEGCQNTWDELPRPGLPLAVALDGGYVHARKGKNRKAGWFEVIVGKSLQEEHESKRFGYVAAYDTKPKQRLYGMLKEQGLQMNQEITFLTDGEDTVRDLPSYLSPRSEHILDWFHITMKITVLKQTAKGILGNDYKKFEDEIESVKWYLWHGNVFRALNLLETIDEELWLDPDETEETKTSKKTKEIKKLQKLVAEFSTYIENNQTSVVNYGERYRYGETISTSFAESTVEEVISRRMVKNQHMRWTQKGAHLLLQLRVKILNHELRNSFVKWYPKMEEKNSILPLSA